MFLTIDATISQLCLDVKASEPSIMFFYVQALLAIFYWSPTHAVDVPVFLASTVLYPVGESLANEPPKGSARLHSYIRDAWSVRNLNVLPYRYGRK